MWHRRGVCVCVFLLFLCVWEVLHIYIIYICFVVFVFFETWRVCVCVLLGSWAKWYR